MHQEKNIFNFQSFAERKSLFQDFATKMLKSQKKNYTTGVKYPLLSLPRPLLMQFTPIENNDIYYRNIIMCFDSYLFASLSHSDPMTIKFIQKRYSLFFTIYYRYKVFKVIFCVKPV